MNQLTHKELDLLIDVCGYEKESCSEDALKYEIGDKWYWEFLNEAADWNDLRRKLLRIKENTSGRTT